MPSQSIKTSAECWILANFLLKFFLAIVSYVEINGITENLLTDFFLNESSICFHWIPLLSRKIPVLSGTNFSVEPELQLLLLLLLLWSESVPEIGISNTHLGEGSSRMGGSVFLVMPSFVSISGLSSVSLPGSLYATTWNDNFSEEEPCLCN